MTTGFALKADSSFKTGREAHEAAGRLFERPDVLCVKHALCFAWRDGIVASDDLFFSPLIRRASREYPLEGKEATNHRRTGGALTRPSVGLFVLVSNKPPVSTCPIYVPTSATLTITSW